MNHKLEEVLELVLQAKAGNHALEPLFSVYLPMTRTIIVQRRSTSHRIHTHHKKDNHQIQLNKISDALFVAR